MSNRFYGVSRLAVTDGHVESLRDDDSSDAVDEKESGGKNDGAVDTATAKHYLP